MNEFSFDTKPLHMSEVWEVDGLILYKECLEGPRGYKQRLIAIDPKYIVKISGEDPQTNEILVTLTTDTIILKYVDPGELLRLWIKAKTSCE